MASNVNYLRGEANIPIKSIPDKKLKGVLRKTEKKFRDGAAKAEQAELLLPEEAGYLVAEGMERTYKFTQKEIGENVDLNTSQKLIDLKLDEFGPYRIDFTRNGRHLLIGGKKGHIATFDWKSGKLGCEIHVKETVRDVKWLHNETMFAVAQKKYTYIYDNTGLEIHSLRNHVEVNRLDFLPYHFLLVSVGNPGYLRYQDVSTGKLVAELRTKLGPCSTMSQNPHNAIMHLGHANGTVTLWSPNMTTPLVKMLCHKGPVQALAMDREGYYMATAGLDSQLKIWDIRKFKPVHEYFTHTPAGSLDISQMGLLAVGYGGHVNIWKDALKIKAKSPYLTHLVPSSTITDLAFCPFEDVLAYGHDAGVATMIVPGSGEPNFDSLEVNPYQTKKQRRETEVHSLLDKLQPEMITLDPNVIGSVDRDLKDVINEERALAFEANNPSEKWQPRHKARGKSSALRRYLRKQSNVIDPKKEMLRKKLEMKQKMIAEKRKRARGEETEEQWTALQTFKKKKDL